MSALCFLKRKFIKNAKKKSSKILTSRWRLIFTFSLGYSFAAGTTDGPGAFDFTQATTTDNEFW